MKLTRILLNSKQLNSTNHKDIEILYFIIPLIYALVLFTFIYFNSLEYYAAPGDELIEYSLETIEQFLSQETIELVKKDIVIANNHELIAGKLSNDTFAEEFYIVVTKHSTAALNQTPGRISEIFVNLHPNRANISNSSNSSNMFGYTFTEFNFISKAGAKKMASREANNIFPQVQVGVLNSIKINLNYISEKIGFGELFDTVDIVDTVTLETARSEYIKTRTEEILQEQDNNFMETLQVNQQYRCALRENANRKGACLLANPEEKFKFCQNVETYFKKMEKNSSATTDFLKKQSSPFFIENFANAYQYESNLELLPLSGEKSVKPTPSILEMDCFNRFRLLLSHSILYINNADISKPAMDDVPMFLIKQAICEQNLGIFDDIFWERINPPEDSILVENIRLNLIELSKKEVLLNHPEISVTLFDNFYENKGIIFPEESQVGAFHGPQIKNELNVSNVTNVTILAKD